MNEILFEIKNIKNSPSDLRKFGLTIGIVFILIALILLWMSKSPLIWGVIGIVIILAAFLYPSILKPLNKIWMIFAILLGWVMTRVILSILFYFAITLIRFLALAFNKKFLDFKMNPSAKSYWEKREKKKFDPSTYERQF